MTDYAEVLRTLIAQLDEPLTRVREEQQRLDEEVRRLEQERHGLELALMRVSGEPPVVIGVSQGETGTGGEAGAVTEVTISEVAVWRAKTRSDAVEDIFKDVGRPLDRRDIRAWLVSHGRDDALDDISATLSHLRRTKRVHRRDDGKWELTSADSDEELTRLLAEQDAELRASGAAPVIVAMPSYNQEAL